MVDVMVSSIPEASHVMRVEHRHRTRANTETRARMPHIYNISLLGADPIALPFCSLGLTSSKLNARHIFQELRDARRRVDLDGRLPTLARTTSRHTYTPMLYTKSAHASKDGQSTCITNSLRYFTWHLQRLFT